MEEKEDEDEEEASHTILIANVTNVHSYFWLKVNKRNSSSGNQTATESVQHHDGTQYGSVIAAVTVLRHF